MEQVKVKYGTEMVEMDIAGARSVVHLQANEMPVIEDLKGAFLEAITTGAIQSPGLDQLIGAEDQVTIIISDLTRFWMRQDILTGYLVEYLHESLGLPFDSIKILVALGTHRENTPEEREKLAGSYAYANVEVIDHDCDSPDLVLVGTTSRETSVWLNPLVVGRKVISMGGTVHHLMAGYGGGRKSILPGVASRRTIMENHRHSLDPEKAMSNVKIGSGRMTENPVHEDMGEAADLVDVAFGINIVMSAKGGHSGLFCGDFKAAWKESCRYVQRGYGVPIQHEADVVIASCGGFPKDINLYQSTKTLFNAVGGLKKGGTLILLASCPEGGGAKDFFDWLAPLKEGRLDQALRENFTIGGYIFYAACENAQKGTTYLLSTIDPDLVKEMGIYAHPTMEEILAKVDFTDKDVYIMENGGSLMPQLRENYDFFCGDIQ